MSDREAESGRIPRRGFMQVAGAAAAWGMAALAGWPKFAGAADAPRDADGKVIPGFEKGKDDPNANKGWKSIGDRKLRVGIAGYGLCKFGSAFYFQNHPNVEVVAVSDLDPPRCAGRERSIDDTSLA